MRRTRFTTLTASLTLLGLATLAGAQTLKYPKTPTVNTTDNYHGAVVADPYRWLEDDNASETKQWVEDQNKVTFAYLDTIPQREKIRSRLTQLWNYEKYGMPSKDGGKYFFFYNTGLQPQSVLFVTSSLDDKGRVLIDPNTLTADGTAALAGMDVTEDGAKIAYGVADAGSDWNTWRVRDVATGKDLADEIRWVKFSGASWTKDGKGFFYSRFDAPEEGKALTGSNFYQKVYHHTVGQDQSKDVLVYDRPDQRDWGFSAGVTDDGQYLVINVAEGTDRRNRLFYRDLRSNPLNGAVAADGVKGIEQAIKAGVEFIARLEATDAGAESLEGARKAVAALREQRADVLASSRNTSRAVVELLNDFDASYNFVDNDGPVFLFQTDLDAPRGRVIAIDTNNPERKNWKEIIPQSDATLTGVSVVGGHIITNYLRDAASEVKVYDLAGKFVRNVDLPGIGSAGGFGGKRDDPETFYSFTGYTAPPTIYRYDVASGKSVVFKQAKVDFDPSQYETKQVFYKSKDGTRVPMFISHRKGLELNGANPTLLYGYGGFNISITPSFSVSNLVWMEMGGVYAVANLRGGGEYGEEWHQAGTKLKKQNVFDDFIGAAEWLISSKYTQPSKLAILGGSNGGLLVGACMTQRPELFGAAIPAVGVLDMLRFHKFTIGHAWRSDYGSSENEDEFHALFAYSPYHTLLRMKNPPPPPKFPATMITTADHDDRVVPGHSFKFAAALQAVGAPSGVVDMDRPLLIRVETRAGHGAGKPTAKRIEEAADVWGFLQRTLKVESSAN